MKIAQFANASAPYKFYLKFCPRRSSLRSFHPNMDSPSNACLMLRVRSNFNGISRPRVLANDRSPPRRRDDSLRFAARYSPLSYS